MYYYFLFIFFESRWGFCKCQGYIRRDGERLPIPLGNMRGDFHYIGYKWFSERKKYEKCLYCYFKNFKKELKKIDKKGFSKPNNYNQEQK